MNNGDLVRRHNVLREVQDLAVYIPSLLAWVVVADLRIAQEETEEAWRLKGPIAKNMWHRPSIEQKWVNS